MPGEPDPSRLAAFFDNSPDAIVVVDETGTILTANDRVEALFGYEPAALEGRPVEVLVPEADRQAHVRQREEYMVEPTARMMETGLDLRGRRKDGSTFPVDVSLSPIPGDEGVEVMAAVRDISERDRLQRKYQTLIELAPDAVFVADAASGEIREVNRRATDLLGIPADDLVGMQQADLHPEEDRERYEALFRQTAGETRRTVAQFDNGDQLYVETRDDERVPVEISAQVAALGGDDVVFGLFRDISERKARERELHQQINRLESLASVLSHDVRNPLNVAEARVDLARDTGDLDHLDAVDRAHDRIEEIVEDVLTMVRDGAEAETIEPLEIRSVVEECWQSVATEGATIQVVSDGLVYADRRRVRHLFENLFRNAIEHGGTDVTVHVGVTEDGFFVADDGPGLPAEEPDAVFEPGWTTRDDGTGLGLNIVAEVASAHGWDVTAGTGIDGGSRFTVSGVRTSVYEDSFESTAER